MKLKNIKENSLFNRTAIAVAVLTIACGLLYWLADIYVDKAFADDGYMREILEKLSVAALFCVYGATIIYLIGQIFYYQETLRRQEKKYQDYINYSPDPMVITDHRGMISETNPAMEKMTAKDRNSLVLLNLADLMTADSIQACYSFFMQIEKTQKAESSLRMLSGERIISVSANAVKLDESRILITLRDISGFVEVSNNYRKLNLDLQEQVKAELSKVRLQEQALENTKKFADMGNMLTAISHHWRQPLNALGLQVQDMVETCRTGSVTEEYIREFDEVTGTLINDMSGTIDKFRNFFSFSSDDSEINIISEIMDVLNILSAQIYYLGVDVLFSCGCEKQHYDCKNIFTCPDCKFKSATVRGDVGNFRHAVLNIIYNALDSVTERKKTDNTKGVVKVKIRCDDRNVFIDIEDNGKGFSDEVLKRAFEPYYSTKGEGKGAGIGLFMVKMVLSEQMGGEVMLGNTDMGANVHVVLPKAADCPES
ncbi:MAG: ATP-binding protein [Deferribacterales bacterium]